MQPLDRIGHARAAPLARRQSCVGEQPIAGFLQAIGNGAVLEPPLSDEGLAAGFNLLARGGVDHVGVVGGDLLVQALGGVREEIAMLSRAKAWRRRWLNVAGGLLLLLIIALGVVFPFMLAQLIMLLLGQ